MFKSKKRRKSIVEIQMFFHWHTFNFFVEESKEKVQSALEKLPFLLYKEIKFELTEESENVTKVEIMSICINTLMTVIFLLGVNVGMNMQENKKE